MHIPVCTFENYTNYHTPIALLSSIIFLSVVLLSLSLLLSLLSFWLLLLLLLLFLYTTNFKVNGSTSLPHHIYKIKNIIIKISKSFFIENNSTDQLIYKTIITMPVRNSPQKTKLNNSQPLTKLLAHY